MIIDDLKTPFRWYNTLAELNSQKALCKDFRYNLITPEDRLLPFIIRFPTPTTPQTYPLEMNIYYADTGALALYVLPTVVASLVNYYRFNGYDYLVYNGDPLQSLIIPPGYLRAELVMQDGTKYYSVEFWVDCDVDGRTFLTDFNSDFNLDFGPQVNIGGIKKYTKIQWWDKCDIGNLFYSKGFINILYIDSEILRHPAKTLEEGVEDDIKNFIPTFQKLIDIIGLVDYTPEHVTNALESIKVHANCTVTTKENLYVGFARQFSVTNTQETDCFSKVDITFEMESILMRTQCCQETLLDDVYGDTCDVAIASLIFSQALSSPGFNNVSASWSNLHGTPLQYEVTSPQISGGVPQVTTSTNLLLGTFPIGAQLDVTVRPRCNAPNGRATYGNSLVGTILVQ